MSISDSRDVAIRDSARSRNIATDDPAERSWLPGTQVLFLVATCGILWAGVVYLVVWLL